MPLFTQLCRSGVGIRCTIGGSRPRPVVPAGTTDRSPPLATPDPRLAPSLEKVPILLNWHAVEPLLLFDGEIGQISQPDWRGFSRGWPAARHLHASAMSFLTSSGRTFASHSLAHCRRPPDATGANICYLATGGPGMEAAPAPGWHQERHGLCTAVRLVGWSSFGFSVSQAPCAPRRSLAISSSTVITHGDHCIHRDCGDRPWA